MIINKIKFFKISFIILYIFISFFSLLKNADAATALKTFQIQSSNDDAAEIKSNGNMILDESTIDLGYNDARSKDQIVGLRFANIDVPENAVIRSAYLRFFAYKYGNGAVDFTITGEDSDNSVSFTDASYNISTRSRTEASTIWSPVDWNEPWVSGEIHKSTDISDIINEICSRPGFEPGNAITFFIEGDDKENKRSIYSYDNFLHHPDRIRFARLIIEYDHAEPGCTLMPLILNSTSTDFLPDYSFAGYEWGTEKLPDVQASNPDLTYVDILSYGAVPNDNIDDTQYILNAIANHKNTQGMVLLHFPAGRFIVSDVVMIDRSNFILQGEGNGANGTIFQIDRPMSDLGIKDIPKGARSDGIYDKYRDVISILNDYEENSWPTTGSEPYSLFSWTGGFFYTRYDGHRYGRETIADVNLGAKRGERTFLINNKRKSLNVGDVIRFEWGNPASNSFLNYILGPDPVTIGEETSRVTNGLVAQPVTVVAINENHITIQEPLLHDVKPEWTARIRTVFFNENVGFENFSIEFPNNTDYGGHHLEDGYNGMYLADLNNSWVRNVSIHNSDSAIIVDHSKNSTLQGIKTTGRAGHYNISMGRSYGILARDFDLQSPATHNPSFNSCSVLNVYSGGYVHTAKVDQHYSLNHQNLFDNVSVGYSPNLFSHGGNSKVLPTSAMYNTFWNIEVKELFYNNLVGSCEDAPGARLIGIHSPGNILSVDYSPKPYIEGLNECLAVPSLYDYQLQKRLNSAKSAPQGIRIE